LLFVILQTMYKKRGRSHTTLTETAALVTKVLSTIPGIKMIAPGIIDGKRSGKRFITIVHTNPGFELIISGSGVQKISVHITHQSEKEQIIKTLKSARLLQQFNWNERQRNPGI
jgi:hypothetical protein